MNTAPKNARPGHPGATAGRPTRRSLLAFGLVAAGSLGAAGYFLWPALRQNLSGAAADAVPVSISMSGFAPIVLTVKAGQPVRLLLVNRDNSLHSDGGGWHQFASEELGLDFKVGPLSEQLVSFTVDKPGTYGFYCNVCCGGKANPYMNGRLIVEA
jgi:heme/copper-type cytochrome/quinol oxidase subunit 2